MFIIKFALVNLKLAAVQNYSYNVPNWNNCDNWNAASRKEITSHAIKYVLKLKLSLNNSYRNNCQPLQDYKFKITQKKNCHSKRVTNLNALRLHILCTYIQCEIKVAFHRFVCRLHI